VGEKVTESYGAIREMRVAKLPAQVLRDVAIQLQRSLLHELHDDDGRERFRDRRNSHEAFRCQSAIVSSRRIDRGSSEGGLEAHLAATQDCHGKPGEGAGRIPTAVRQIRELTAYFIF